MDSNLKLKRLLSILIALAAFNFAACENDSDLENAAEEAGDSVEDAGEAVGDAAEDAADGVRDATN